MIRSGTIIGTIVGFGIMALAFFGSYKWYGVIESWCGDWPKIVAVVAWAFLGGIPIIVLGIFVGLLILKAAWE